MSQVLEYLSKMSKGEVPHPGSGASATDVVAAGKAAGYDFTVEDLTEHQVDDLDSAGGGCNFNMDSIDVNV